MKSKLSKINQIILKRAMINSNQNLNFKIPRVEELNDFEIIESGSNDLNNSLGQIDDEERRFFEELA